MPSTHCSLTAHKAKSEVSVVTATREAPSGCASMAASMRAVLVSSKALTYSFLQSTSTFALLPLTQGTHQVGHPWNELADVHHTTQEIHTQYRHQNGGHNKVPSKFTSMETHSHKPSAEGANGGTISSVQGSGGVCQPNFPQLRPVEHPAGH